MGTASIERVECGSGECGDEIAAIRDRINPELVVQSFYSDNFNGTITRSDNCLLESDRWDVRVRVNGADHLIHSFETRAHGETLKIAFDRLAGEMNSLWRFYGRGYQWKPRTGKMVMRP